MLTAITLVQGCALLVVGGLAAGAAYGTIQYVNNTLRVTHNVPLEVAWNAGNDALRDLEIGVETSMKDGASGKLTAHNAHAEKVTIHVTRKADKVTDIEITVGTFDDAANRAEAQQIYTKMKSRF
jgi:hypothetical protein